MKCPSCEHQNESAASYCEECGIKLAHACAVCGYELKASAKFCPSCGQRVESGPGASLRLDASRQAGSADDAATRKTVTIVFADLIGSTSLHERLDAESARRLMDRYYRALHAAVEAEGGTVVKLLGDGVMAAFGVPRVAEDDAIRAVRAAVGMQRAFRDLLQERGSVVGTLGLRVGVNTGEVVVSADHTDVVGDPVNVAARLQQEGRDGDVLIGESTRRLVSELVTLAPLGELTLKGRSESVEAYRVKSLERPAGVAAIPFVGREEELRRLMAVYDRVASQRSAGLAVIVGSPGLGKSRLISEFARRLGERAKLLTAHCDAAGGATFAPLAAALRNLLQLDDSAGGETVRAAVDASLRHDDAERGRIVDGIVAVLAGAPAAPEETFFVVRRFVAAFAAVQPVVLVIDDLHWAEPLLLDLTEHLVQWSTDVPLLVLAGARPELRELRPSLAIAGGLIDDVVTLSGLDAGAATRLAANVVGAQELPAALAGRLLATSEGNPLFLGELVRMLVDDGTLRQEGGRWVAAVDLADLEVPPTIHALLAARIERLRPEECTILERAGIIGRHFSRAAVAHLLPPELAADLETRLESLRRSELIQSDTGWFLGEPLLRFHHALIRDAAYRRLLKGTRAELHERFADWLESRVGKGVEHDETIGWHLEQAHQYLLELGSVDTQSRSVGERASRYLAAAGRRALARDDLPLAASLLARAIERLDDSDASRAELALDWCEALLAAGDVGPAARAIDELARFTGSGVGGRGPGVGEEVGSDAASLALKSPADPRPPTPDSDASGRLDRLRAWHTCFAGQLAVLTNPQALRATADAVAAAAAELAGLNDAAGEAKAHSVHALALARLGQVGACETALDHALAAARRAGDRRRANAVLAGAPLAALSGPSPVTRASGRCLDVVRVLRITQGSPAVEAVALRCQAVLEALRGRTEAARRMIATSKRLVEELGITQRLLEADVFAGRIELLEGDAIAAERCLRPAYEGLRDRGLGIDAARAAALLGRALLAQSRAAEAEALSHESEALAGDDLEAAIAWRGVRAEALARRGEHAAAVTFARAAVDIAAATDALLDHADARLALAVALRAAGREEDAAGEEARAIDLWQAKGASLLAERARGETDPEAAARPAGAQKRAEGARHRVRLNAATANTARMDAAIAAHDINALFGTLADDAQSIHHPTGSVYLERDSVNAYALLFTAENLTFAHLPLATLGESLALCRGNVSFDTLRNSDAVPMGASNFDTFVLAEVDARGLRRSTEFFALDRLGDAVARLYERHAELLADGSERQRAAATARSAAALLGPPDLEQLAGVLDPDVELIDHPTQGLGSAHGAPALLENLRSSIELVVDLVTRCDDVLALEPDALLVRSTNLGRERSGGGAFERAFIQLCLFGSDGLLQRIEWFDADRADEAGARFDELTGTAPALAFANAVTRAQELFERNWRARDWNALVASYSRDAVMDDRRPIVGGLLLEGASFFENIRLLFDIFASYWSTQVLATRGERLALFRARFAGEVAGGSHIAEEHLSLTELNAAGERVAIVIFDLDDLDAAHAELDRRYAAGEARAYAALLANMEAFRLAAKDRDREALERIVPEDFTLISHRRFGSTGMRLNREQYGASLTLIDDLEVRADLRLHHQRLSPTASLGVLTWSGTRDGGAFEAPLVFVAAHDGRRVHAWELFDLEDLDAARARYAELSAARAALPRIETAATRMHDKLVAAFQARDWERLSSLFPPGFRSRDHQWHVESDRGPYLEAFRPMFEMFASIPTVERLATRGERLLLSRNCWMFSGAEAGDSQIDWLSLLELDDRGDVAMISDFDPDAVDAAYAELEARYAAGEGAEHEHVAAAMRAFRSAFAARDWETLTAQLSLDLAVHDHQLLGWDTLRGPAEYVQALRSLVDLAPDTRLRLDHVTVAEGGYLVVATWVGTREGGPFETPSVVAGELDDRQRVQRFDFYDLDQLDAAIERFAAIRAGAHTATRASARAAQVRDDLLRIPPNAATRASDRRESALYKHDWEALEALYSPSMVFEDRRRGALVSGGLEMVLASVRLIFSIRTRMLRTRLASAGDRLALDRILWTGPPGIVTAELETPAVGSAPPTSAAEVGPGFEAETLQLTEVDADGLVVASINFDADDRLGASIELRERYYRSDAAQAIPASVAEIARALDARDLDRLRAALPSDFVLHDHRRGGAGRLEGIEDYIAAVVALFTLVPDVHTENLRRLVDDEHGSLSVARAFGALAEGGPFESFVLRLIYYREGRVAGAELFELEDLARAQARFEELREQHA